MPKKPYRFRVQVGMVGHHPEVVAGRYRTVRGVVNCISKYHNVSCLILDIKKQKSYSKNDFLDKFTDPNSIRFIKDLAKGE